MKEIINGHEIEIKSELSPEIIDFLIESHKSIFSKEFHFNPIFFEMVEKTITEFGKDFNPEKDFTLIAYVDGEKMGSISGIGREKGNVQLRFYFLHEGARGMKLGKKLFVAVIVQITFSITFGKPSPELFRKIFRCFDPLEIFSENLVELVVI
jgi:hypothetical protein